MTTLNPSGFTTEAMNQALAQLLQRNADVMESLLKQRGEARVEGLSMPQFHGRMGESVELYFDQVVQYLQAKNIDYQDRRRTRGYSLWLLQTSSTMPTLGIASTSNPSLM